ncbi:MAG: hypothetical protein JNN26_03750 [Candidatus Obscuribacter sp.]|nr:hypothetical protein [Candidatus Obscuribacter sp.]
MKYDGRPILNLSLALAAVLTCPGFRLNPAYAQDQRQKPPENGYIGNIISLKFHEVDCPYGRIMALSKRRYLPSKSACLAQGMRPCHFCLPPREKTVSCKILFETRAKADR